MFCLVSKQLILLQGSVSSMQVWKPTKHSEDMHGSDYSSVLRFTAEDALARQAAVDFHVYPWIILLVPASRLAIAIRFDWQSVIQTKLRAQANLPVPPTDAESTPVLSDRRMSEIFPCKTHRVMTLSKFLSRG